MPTVHSEGSRRKARVNLSGEAHVSAHLCDAYLINTGVFGHRNCNQTLVDIAGAAVQPVESIRRSRAMSSPEPLGPKDPFGPE